MNFLLLLLVLIGVTCLQANDLIPGLPYEPRDAAWRRGPQEVIGEVSEVKWTKKGGHARLFFADAPGFLVFVSAEMVAKLGRERVEALAGKTVRVRGHAKRFSQWRQLGARSIEVL